MIILKQTTLKDFIISFLILISLVGIGLLIQNRKVIYFPNKIEVIDTTKNDDSDDMIFHLMMEQ